MIKDNSKSKALKNGVIYKSNHEDYKIYITITGNNRFSQLYKMKPVEVRTGSFHGYLSRPYPEGTIKNLKEDKNLEVLMPSAFFA